MKIGEQDIFTCRIEQSLSALAGFLYSSLVLFFFLLVFLTMSEVPCYSCVI